MDEAPVRHEGDEDVVPAKHGIQGWLNRRRRTRTGRLSVRLVLTVLGFAVVGAGVAMIPLPGPGWAVVIAGLAILALEYAWAHNLMTFTKRQVRAWLHWIGRQHLLVRGLVGLLGFVFIGGVLWLSLKSTLGFDYIGWGLGLFGW